MTSAFHLISLSSVHVHLRSPSSGREGPQFDLVLSLTTFALSDYLIIVLFALHMEADFNDQVTEDHILFIPKHNIPRSNVTTAISSEEL